MAVKMGTIEGRQLPAGFDTDPVSFLFKGSLEVSDFTSNYWEKKPYLVKANEERRRFFEGLLGLKDLKCMKESVGEAKDSEKEEEKDSDSSSDSESSEEEEEDDDYEYDVYNYTNTGVEELPESMYDASKLKAMLACGFTVEIEQPQRRHDDLWRLLAALEAGIGSLVGSSAYIHAADNKDQLPQFLELEGFICQMEGKQRFRLYDPPEDVNESMDELVALGVEGLGNPILDAILSPGDILYIPRGKVYLTCPVEGEVFAPALSKAEKKTDDEEDEDDDEDEEEVECPALCSFLYLSTYDKWNYAKLAKHLLDYATEVMTNQLPRSLVAGLPFGHVFQSGLLGDHLFGSKEGPSPNTVIAAADLARALRTLAEIVEADPEAYVSPATDALADEFMRRRLPPHPAQVADRGPHPESQDDGLVLTCRNAFLVVPDNEDGDDDEDSLDGDEDDLMKGRGQGMISLLSCLQNDRRNHLEETDEFGHDHDHDHDHGHDHDHDHHDGFDDEDEDEEAWREILAEADGKDAGEDEDEDEDEDDEEDEEEEEEEADEETGEKKPKKGKKKAPKETIEEKRARLKAAAAAAAATKEGVVLGESEKAAARRHPHPYPHRHHGGGCCGGKHHHHGHGHGHGHGHRHHHHHHHDGKCCGGGAKKCDGNSEKSSCCAVKEEGGEREEEEESKEEEVKKGGEKGGACGNKDCCHKEENKKKHANGKQAEEEEGKGACSSSSACCDKKKPSMKREQNKGGEDSGEEGQKAKKKKAKKDNESSDHDDKEDEDEEEEEEGEKVSKKERKKKNAKNKTKKGHQASSGNGGKSKADDSDDSAESEKDDEDEDEDEDEGGSGDEVDDDSSSSFESFDEDDDDDEHHHEEDESAQPVSFPASYMDALSTILTTFSEPGVAIRDLKCGQAEDRLVLATALWDMGVVRVIPRAHASDSAPGKGRAMIEEAAGGSQTKKARRM